MAVETVTMYRVLCDRCGKADDGDYYAWLDVDQATTVAAESNWLITDGGEWCPDCVQWDEDADELRPMSAITSTLRRR